MTRSDAARDLKGQGQGHKGLTSQTTWLPGRCDLKEQRGHQGVTSFIRVADLKGQQGH